MSATDHTAAAIRGEPPDDPDPDVAVVDDRSPDAWCGGAGRRHDLDDELDWALDVDTRLDGATAARLRDESRLTRARIERRLSDAGHLPLTGDESIEGVDDADVPSGDDAPDRVEAVDQWRDLGDLLDEHVGFLEQIDGLHEQRLRSPSPRERQAATRALGEALYRIVDGYRVDVEAPHRPVMAARRVDLWLGRTVERLAGARRRPPIALRWWAHRGRWVRLALALVAGLMLAQGNLVLGAAAVTARAGLSLVLFAPAPHSPRRRALGYNPDWAACICTHIGDAAILTGLGFGLHAAGETTWGAVTVLAALFGLIATMLRVATGHQGFRLPRLWLDRAVRTVVLPAAVVGAAVAGEPDAAVVGGAPGAAIAVVAVVAIGVVEICRTLYYALRRRRLFRRAEATHGGPLPDVIVAHTSDALVMNITRPDPRRTVFGRGPDDTGARHLRAVSDGAGNRSDEGTDRATGRQRRVLTRG